MVTFDRTSADSGYLSLNSSGSNTPVTSPVTSPQKRTYANSLASSTPDIEALQLTSPPRKPRATPVKLPCALNLLTHPLFVNPVGNDVNMDAEEDYSDQISTALAADDTAELHQIFSQCEDQLFSILDDFELLDAGDALRLHDQMKIYFAAEMKKAVDADNTKRVQELLALSPPNRSLLSESFHEAVQDSDSDSEKLAFYKKCDIQVRLSQAVDRKNIDEIEELVRDCKELGLSLNISQVNPADVSWVNDALLRAKILQSLCPLNLEEFKSCTLEKLQQIYDSLKEGIQKQTLSRIIRYAHLMQRDLEETDQITKVDALKISLFVEDRLQKALVVSHFPQKKRAVVIDPEKRDFFVLSGDLSRYKAAGAEIKVTSAFYFPKDGPTKQLAVKENLENDDLKLMRKQAELAKKIHGDIYHIVTDGKGKKLFVIEGFYPLNAFQFCTSKERLEPHEIRQILKAVAKTLCWMHENGFVHADVKAENVLLKRSVSGLKAKLSDFGSTFNGSDFSQPADYMKSYTTPEYSAPEFWQERSLPWTVQEASFHDMYSTGCMLYKFLQGQEVSWNITARRLSELKSKKVSVKKALQALSDKPECAVRKKNYETELAELTELLSHRSEQEKQHAILSQQVQNVEDAEMKALWDICLGLIHPSASSRMTARQLLQAT